MSAASANSTSIAVFEAPYSKVSVQPDDIPDHTLMRARQLSSLLLSMQGDDGPDSLLWLAQQISDELVVCIESAMHSKGAA